jgi:hypothetical protein
MKHFIQFCMAATLLFACANHTFAQAKSLSDSIIAPKKAKPAVEKKGILRLTERSIEGGINTSGWSIGYNTGEAHTYYKTDFWHFAFGEIKDAREILSSTKNAGGGGGSGGGQNPQARPFIYGKQNSLLMLQAGRSTKRQLSEKAEQRGVKVGYSYAYGVSLGMLKPYYLDILKQQVRGSSGNSYIISSVRYTDTTANDFLYGNIYGASPFTKGLDEIKFLPGGFARLGLNFDWLTNDEETLWSLQTGLRADAYLTTVPLMVTPSNVTNTDKFVFFNLYAILQLGKRY